MRAFRWGIVLALGLLLPRAAALAPSVVEALYSRGLFPLIADGLGRIAGRFQQSLTQVMVLLTVALLVAALTAAVVITFRKRSLARGFGPPHRWLALLAVAVWAFYGLWGLNYSRQSVTRRLDLEKPESTTEDLTRLARVLALEVNRTFAWAERGGQIDPEAGHSDSPEAPRRPSASRIRIDRLSIADRLAAAYGSLQPAYAERALSSPKFPSLASRVMTRAGISGFYFPFTGEANVNALLPDASVPFTMAHEMAHQRGTAREDEANFWAYLACRETGLAAARYSGSLHAFGIALNALWREEPDSARALTLEVLDPGPMRDRAAIRAFWDRHEGPASRAATRVNDSYLKVNAQRAGVRSYGLAVELLLALEQAGGMDDD